MATDVKLFSVPSDADPHDVRLQGESGGGIVGNLAVTLGALVLAAIASVDVQGSTGATLGALTLSSQAQVEVKGDLSQTLEALTLSGAAQVEVKADLTKTLAELTLLGLGQADVQAWLDDDFTTPFEKTLDPVTLTSQAAVDVQGTLVKTLAALTLDGQAKLDAQATLVSTFDALTLTADGSVTSGGINGDLDVFLDDCVLTATGHFEHFTLVTIPAGRRDGISEPKWVDLFADEDEARGGLSVVLEDMSLSASGTVTGAVSFVTLACPLCELGFIHACAGPITMSRGPAPRVEACELCKNEFIHVCLTEVNL